MSHDPLPYSLLQDVTDRADYYLWMQTQIRSQAVVPPGCFQNLREIVQEQFDDFKSNLAALPTREQAIQNQAEAWAIEALHRSGLLANTS